MMKVRLFTSGDCARCREATRLLDEFARHDAPPGFVWQQVSVRMAMAGAARRVTLRRHARVLLY